MGNCCCFCPRVGDKYHISDLMIDDVTTMPNTTYDGVITKGRVVSVYDGDTVTVAFYDGSKVVKRPFRMYGYDAPEIHPRKDIHNRDLHVRAGNSVKQYLSDCINNKIVWIRFCKEEKYGRLMGYIYLQRGKNDSKLTSECACMNQVIIDQRYGKLYDGGTKSEFTAEELEYIVSKLSYK